MNQIENLSTLFEYLNAVFYGEHEIAHDIIDEQGCNLTHVLTGFLMTWVASHARLPDDMNFQDWLKKSSMEQGQFAAMTPDQRREFIMGWGDEGEYQ